MKNILKIFAVITFIMGGLAFNSSTVGAEQTQEENNQSIGQFEQINESQANIKLNEGISYEISENGTTKITNESTGETEVLPSETKDKNGNEVALMYQGNDDNLQVNVVEKSTQLRGWQDALQCGLGTAGGIGTGGLGGATAGSALPGVGTVSGGIVGGIAGGMTGAAAACF